MILTLACSLSPSIPITEGSGYHFYSLPPQPEEDEAITEYNAISSTPLFPEQSDISPALEQEISDFLTRAIELEIESYRYGSAGPPQQS